MNSTNKERLKQERKQFERYVNFEFYKLIMLILIYTLVFERYVNFEFYKLRLLTAEIKVGLRDM